MKVQLNSSWTLQKCPDSSSPVPSPIFPGSVPGSVYTDLIAAGQMPDPFYRDNEKTALEVISHDYQYSTVFDAPDGLLSCRVILLHFDGIDTLSSIALNGTLLGNTDNMHRTWEFDITKLLRPAGNQLNVILHSPTEFIAESYAEKPIAGAAEAMRGLPRLRKAHCMFGWDWGPRVPDAGIFRPVSLIGINTCRIDSVYITQHHEDGRAALFIELETDSGTPVSSRSFRDNSSSCICYKNKSNIDYRIVLTDPDGVETVYENSPDSIIIDRPQLWWPNGYGSQPLYTIRAELLDEGEIIDVSEKRIGLRTMTVCREKDEFGESFAHEVNGVRIFAMGGDYIPEDNLLPRITKERTRRLLQDARDAHFNVIRVWGGGYYPDDFFYDACDELGLIVWQDFMFACCSYDLTEAFERSVTAEFVDNIKRIRHHACLGLWCGNNEMEMFIADNRDAWCLDPAQFSDYIKLFEYILPKLLKQLDPQTFYWPASPSSGGAFDNPNDENRGDVHYWDVWHGNKPFTEYRKFHFRYVSEFGFQSFPALKTVETFSLPEDRNIFSYVMEKHQRNAAANGKIMNYMEQTFLYPTDFDTVLYASQLLQAEAMRYGVEHFRRSRGRCMGCVIWQLNDCWPTASWSSIDYYGRWKALHYYEKRFFAPLLLSCCEEGTLTQDPNINAQPYDLKKSIALCASNETRLEQTVTVSWELRDSCAHVLCGRTETLTLAPLSSRWMEQVDLPQADIYENYVSFRMEQDGRICSQGTVLFCAPKYFRFRRPSITVTADGDELVISCDCYAKSIRILNEADDLLLDDNYFDMNGGSRRVKILKGQPTGLHVKSVYDIR